MWKLINKLAGNDAALAENDDLPVRDRPVDEDMPAPMKNRIATVERIGPTAVATLTVTELTHETGVELLAELLEDLIQSGATNFVLDIQNVQFMDSACLGCLVEALNRISAMGGKIAMVNTHHSVEYLFRLTRLDRVFPICASVIAALEKMNATPKE